MPGDDLYKKYGHGEPISIEETEAENSEKTANLNRTLWTPQNRKNMFQTTRHRTNMDYLDEITKTITPVDYRQIEILLNNDHI